MTDTTDRGMPMRIGAVDGSADATTRRFKVVLDDHATVQLDDLLVCRQPLPSGEEVAHYGIVVEQYGTIEGAELPSDTRAIALERTMPGLITRCAEVLVLRTVPERWVAPLPGVEVFEALGTERDLALFVDQMDSQLPVGLDQSDQPVVVDWSFVNGEQGGHVSISGVSGVAAKTSFALHLLFTIFETDNGRALLGPASSQARALAFNVKGEDLMHLDRPNRKFTNEEREKWAKLGVADPQPFRSVRFYAPPAPGSGDGNQLVAATVSRPDARVYGWTPESFIRQGLLRYCFTDNDDRSTQVGFVEQVVRAELARHAYPMAGEAGAVVICDQPHTDSRTFERIVTKRAQARVAGDGFPVRNYQDLLDFLVGKLEPDDDGHVSSWAGRTAPGTVMAFLRRLMALSPRLGHLVRCGVEEVQLADALTVVDIHGLHQSAQRFVVGALVSDVFDAKQGTGREPLRFVMLDELNKYAPRDGHSPLKDLFVDIAERGRSLGVLLVGCQQAAGRVAEPVVRQPALKVCGRLDATEAAEYRFLGAELRERATRFLPGTMVLDQPLVPAPIPIRFPFPPFATNSSDRALTSDQREETDRAFEALA